MKQDSHILPAEEAQTLLATLKTRFEKNRKRHENIQWAEVASKLQSHPDKLRSLYEMEQTGGEPDVVGYDADTQEFLFFDCSAESPKGRRSLCYDRESQESRKDFPPENNVLDLAMEMGIEILSEEQYRTLQQLGTFDTKTSSWLRTPADIRKLGGAIFADFRYGHVFVYHNGAQSYYAARGFRGCVSV